MRILAFTIWLLSALFTLQATPASAQTTDVTLQLKWFHQFQFAGYYAAQQLDYYAEEGLNVHIREISPGESYIDSVLTGTAEFGVADSTLILQYMQGAPVVILAPIFQHSPLVLASLKEREITHPKQLRGLRVMRHGGIDDASISAMLYAESVKEDELIHVEHTFDDLALLKGQTDVMSAYLTNQPFLYEQLGRPLNLLNPSNFGVEFYGDMLFTSQKVMKENPELALAFRRASLKGWDYATHHPEAVVEMILKHYPSRKSREHLLYEAAMTLKMIKPDIIELGHLNLSRFQRIADMYYHLGLAREPESLEQLSYQYYLDDNRSYFRQWLKWGFLFGAVAGVLALISAVINLHLQRLVNLRTQELAKTSQQAQLYLTALDKNVIASQTDHRGIITDASEAFCTISGYTKAELIGKSHNIVRHPDMPSSVYRQLWQTIKQGKIWRGELKNLSKSGKEYWVYATIEPQMNENGAITGFTAIRQDITDKKRVEKLSVTDQLTGVFNRVKLEELFLYEEERSKRYGTPCSIALVDLDHFKKVNDTHGHSMGDQVLVKVSQVMQRYIRTTDTLGRWGGEEFIVIYPNTSIEGAREATEKLREAINNLYISSLGHCSASFGVAALQPGQSYRSLIKQADQALYQAKHLGRNRVEIYSPDATPVTAQSQKADH